MADHTGRTSADSSAGAWSLYSLALVNKASGASFQALGVRHRAPLNEKWSLSFPDAVYL